MKRNVLTAMVICVLALGVLLLAGGPAVFASGDVLVFADLNWDSVQVHNRIAKLIVENGYGYEVRFMPGATITLFAGLARGDVDVEMECWVENQQEAYDEAIAEGSVIDLGANFPDSWQGWLVPTYIIEGDPDRGIQPMAPDLKSVYDMPKYWKLFRDPEDPDKGRFYTCVPGWECEKINEKKFKAYGLDETYNIFAPGSDAALNGSMAAAYKKGEPWFGYYWAPTWVLGKFDMTPLEEPPYDPDKWGKSYKCAYPAVSVNIVVHSELPKKAPDVVEFLKNYETTQAMANSFLAYMQDNKAGTEDAARWFLKNYESVWTKWVPAGVAAKVKAALK